MSLNFKLGILEPKQSILKIKDEKKEISSTVDKININTSKNEKRILIGLIDKLLIYILKKRSDN